ncbi:hypothetical protein EYC80_000097 [Monilinia laxa]|uniref:Major facilitator superfamily (MFS) profile domain-containing protein n=1 Tax=Monilinia laxa TaxID=61186 RepID=A0A5N6K9Q6_MONLA|nr:hypothetical protein EYC80_000097 [Monilinia laxa]
MEKGLSGLDSDLDLDLDLYRDSKTKSHLNGLKGLEENLEEKREKELEKDEDRDRDSGQDKDKDTDLGKVEDKDRKIGYKANKEDCAESIEVEYTEDLDGELKEELGRDGTLGAEKKKREGRLGEIEIGIGIEKLKDKSTEKEAHHHHVSKSQTDGDEEEVVREAIEDLDDLDLAELNSGDDLLPDEDDEEEEGGVSDRGIGTHGVDGAADEGFGGVSSERDAVGFNEAHFKVYKRRWFGLVQLVLLNIIVSWDWLTFSASSTTVSQYYNVSESAINWLSTAFLFAFVLASPFVIYVLHHGGPKPAILIASVLLLLGNWIRYGATRSGTHGNFGGVMFGQILTGIAQPFVLAAPTRYSDLWFTNQGRVAATAVMSLANPFGGALAQLIDPFWAGSVGSIPNMVLYIAIISSVATIPSFFIPKGPPTPCSASSEEPKQHALGPSLLPLFASFSTPQSST